MSRETQTQGIQLRGGVPTLDTVRRAVKNLDTLIVFGVVITLFFMPLHEKLKAAGFWLTLAFWLTKLVKERKEIKVWIPPLGWALLLFVGAAFLSAAFSDYPNRATRGALDALRNTLVFLILANTLNSYKQIKYIILALMGGIVIGDFAAIHKYFSIGPEIEMLSLGEKNSTAQVISMVLALLLGFLLLRRESFFRIIIVGVSGLTGFTLILTYARGIWVALAAMLLIFMLIRLDWKILAALIILAVSISVGMAFSDRLTYKMTSLKSPLTEPNMIGRYQIWKESLNIIKDRPFLGIGLKTYGLSQVKEKYHLNNSTHAHNMYLNVTAELGFVGLGVLVLWLAFYLHSILRMRIYMKLDFNESLWLGGLGCFIILLIGGVTHSMLGSESSLMLMTVLGLMFAGFHIENKESALILQYLYKIPGYAKNKELHGG